MVVVMDTIFGFFSFFSFWTTARRPVYLRLQAGESRTLYMHDDESVKKHNMEGYMG